MDRFLEKVPAGSNNLKSKLFKAEIFIKENKHDDALHLVNEVIRENPADLLAHRMKGNILLVKQDYMGAIAEFRTVLKQEPGNITFSMNLARAHFLNGEPLLAKQICKSILEKIRLSCRLGLLWWTFTGRKAILTGQKTNSKKC